MSTGRAVSLDGVSHDSHPVELSYRHANPERGNESVLLRFGYEGRDGNACLLIDAGDGVVLEDLLGPDDWLLGICLTHAHSDHYQSLSTCVRDDVPVFASQDTVAMLPKVLGVAAEQSHFGPTRDVLDALVSLDGWAEVSPGVRIHPVPAGHAPGAVGFLVRFEAADSPHDILVTGDFTLEDVAGNPGFETDLGSDVEALILTGATGESPEEVLTEALGDALERAIANGRTLVTASALTGVHVATLLAAANDELDVDVPVRLVGQTAKLYDVLGYDHPSVETVPVFDDPHQCLTPGTVTVAGPQVPLQDSSGRLFGELKDDADAAVIQLITNGQPPVTTAGCLTTAYELSMHPSESVLREIVDRLRPVQTVVTHRRRTPKKFNDWPTWVWAPGDGDAYMLFRDGTWQHPPWMRSARRHDAGGTTRLGVLADGTVPDIPLPSIERATRASLEAEGIDVVALRDRIDDARESAVPSCLENGDEGGVDRPTIEQTAMSDAHSSDDRPDIELYRTVNANVEMSNPDEFDLESKAPRDLVSAHARMQLRDDRSADVDDTDSDDGKSHGASDGDDGESHVASDGDVGVEDSLENTVASNHQSSIDDGSEVPVTEDDSTESVPESDHGSNETEPGPDASGPSNIRGDGAIHAEDSLILDPLVAALVYRHLEGDESKRSPDQFVADAVAEYLAVLIRGDEIPQGSNTADLTVEGSDRLRTVLTDVLVDGGFGDLDEAVKQGLISVLSPADSGTVSLDLGRFTSLLDAVVDTHSDSFDSRADVVEAAVLWWLAKLDR